MKLKSFFSIILLMVCGMVFAQELPPIPIDNQVKIGKLDNGLTYYIRHNEYPEKQANFYIAQRVGSIQEEESQRGLAHFLEHMAFNGSEHFKGNGIIDFTRSIGVEFGSDLNAYTSIDETVYRICSVPTGRQSALDSCLLVLKDWSNGLLLEDEEIDKERGVIHQEWQLGESATQRIYQKALPKFYPGSKYGERLPIGLMSVVDNFKYDELRNYYKKWYRPDNQAIIVIGDIDVDHIESVIKDLWKNSTVPADAAKVVPEPVPDTDKAIYVVETDKEQRYSEVGIAMKHDATTPEEKANMMYLVQDYATDLVAIMINNRLSEMAQDPACPFVKASGYDGHYILSKTKDAFQLDGQAKDGKEIETLSTLYREAQRLRQFGFTGTEFERAKAEYMSGLEKLYTNRNKRRNAQYGNEYRDHFLTNEPIPSLEDRYTIMSQLSPMIPLEVINEALKELINTTDSNFVAYIFAQELEGKTYPSETEMAAAIQAVRGETLEAYVDNVKNEPLIPELPAKGAIVSETENTVLGYKELTLSNGAKVIIKKTDFKDDEILFQACAKGGSNAYSDADGMNIQLFDGVIEASGLGEFSNKELTKALAGKQVSISASLDANHRMIGGSTVPKDVETLLQLNYLYFTNVKKDTESYNSLMTMLDLQLKNRDLVPETAFSDSLIVTLYNHSPRRTPLTSESIKQVSYDRVLEMMKESFANASDFVFYFVGNLDEATLRPLIEQYIASLPSTGKKSDFAYLDLLAKGKNVVNFKRKMETPKANAIMMFYKNVPYTLENKIYTDAAGRVLEMSLLKDIREDNSAAYSVMSAGFTQRTGLQARAFLQLYCPMDPQKSDLAISLMRKDLADCAEKMDADNVQKVKDKLLNEADDEAKKNSHWLDIIDEYIWTGIDLQSDYKNIVSAITPEKLAAFLKQLATTSDNVEVIMLPEE